MPLLNATAHVADADDGELLVWTVDPILGSAA